MNLPADSSRMLKLIAEGLKSSGGIFPQQALCYSFDKLLGICQYFAESKSCDSGYGWLIIYLGPSNVWHNQSTWTILYPGDLTSVKDFCTADGSGSGSSTMD
jgi:hypothetical protein